MLNPLGGITKDKRVGPSWGSLEGPDQMPKLRATIMAIPISH